MTWATLKTIRSCESCGRETLISLCDALEAAWLALGEIGAPIHPSDEADARDILEGCIIIARKALSEDN